MMNSNAEAAKQLAADLRTQDGRATAHPYFLVREEVRDFGYDPEYTGDFVWVSVDDNEYMYEPDEKPDDGGTYEKVYYRTRWQFVQAFLTERAADTYKARNAHRHSGRLDTYAESAHRNPEIQLVRALLVEQKKPVGYMVRLSDGKWRSGVWSVPPEWATKDPDQYTIHPVGRAVDTDTVGEDSRWAYGESLRKKVEAMQATRAHDKLKIQGLQREVEALRTRLRPDAAPLALLRRIREDYEALVESDWFKGVYGGQSLGEVIGIDDAPPPPPGPPLKQLAEGEIPRRPKGE